MTGFLMPDEVMDAINSSKFLALDMGLQNVIKASTWNSARVIHREEFGHLSEGAVADIAVLNLSEGKFGFYDEGQNKIKGTQLLECEMTIKGGRVEYDLNVRSIPTVTQVAKV